MKWILGTERQPEIRDRGYYVLIEDDKGENYYVKRFLLPSGEWRLASDEKILVWLDQQDANELALNLGFGND